MERIVVIIGPTAVGKTKISIDLAKKLHTEIISGDSMIIYRNMNIGTAKPSIAERSGIAHHLVDYLEPTDEFSVAQFQELAGKYIVDLNNKNKIPILAGGTGLYVKALLEGYRFNVTPGNEEYRAGLEELIQQRGNQYVYDMLVAVDPLTAARLHVNDKKRIIRALEVHSLGGDTLSQERETDKLMYDAVVIGLNMDRATLYQRINQRVDMMFSEGLVEEVANLLQIGISPQCQAMQGIGYKEIVAYLHGEIDLHTASENIKQATRHFAKRQLTWYRKMSYITWFEVDSFKDYDEMLASIYNHIAGNFSLK